MKPQPVAYRIVTLLTGSAPGVKTKARVRTPPIQSYEKACEALLPSEHLAVTDQLGRLWVLVDEPG
jgi:hypothetical protein